MIHADSVSYESICQPTLLPEDEITAGSHERGELQCLIRPGPKTWKLCLRG